MTMDIEEEEASRMKGLNWYLIYPSCIGRCLWETHHRQQPLGLESSERGQKSLRNQGWDQEDSPGNTGSPPPTPQLPSSLQRPLPPPTPVLSGGGAGGPPIPLQPSHSGSFSVLGPDHPPPPPPIPYLE